jgi:ABC-type multidrug transport system ATPase subunit
VGNLHDEGLGHLPLVEVEGLSKKYEPLPSQRVQKLFSRLGGIPPEEPFFDDSSGDEDDDEDDDDLAEDDEVAPDSRGTVALDDVSFTAIGGSCVAVYGAAGSGKSILLKIVAGVVPPSKGRVVLRGTVAPALDSVVNLFPKATPLERALPVVAGMLRVPPADVRRKLPEILDLFGAPESRRVDASSLPGRRRRELLLATMLSVDASVLLIDTPLPRAADGERYLRQIEEARQRGALVLIATRSLTAIASLADRVLRLRRGRLVSDQPLRDALAEGLDAREV